MCRAISGSRIGFVTLTDGEWFAVSKGGHWRHILSAPAIPILWLRRHFLLVLSRILAALLSHGVCAHPDIRGDGRGAESQGLKACFVKLLHGPTRAVRARHSHSPASLAAAPFPGLHQQPVQLCWCQTFPRVPKNIPCSSKLYDYMINPPCPAEYSGVDPALDHLERYSWKNTSSFPRLQLWKPTAGTMQA